MPSKSKAEKTKTKPAAKVAAKPTVKAAAKTTPKAAVTKTIATKIAAPKASAAPKGLKKKDVAEQAPKATSENIIPALGEMAGPQLSESNAASVSKNFRSHPDMENFYRFIHEHDLRVEALQIVDELIEARRNKKKKPTGALAAAVLN